MITRTITTTTTENKYYDLKNDTVVNHYYSFIGEENPRYEKDGFVYLKETQRVTDTSKYELDESVYIMNAVTFNERIKGRKYMVRTFKDTIVTALYFDVEKMETVEITITMKGEKTVEEANAILSKGKYEGTRKYLKVLNCTYMENAFYLEDEKFLELAEKVSG